MRASNPSRDCTHMYFSFIFNSPRLYRGHNGCMMYTFFNYFNQFYNSRPVCAPQFTKVFYPFSRCIMVIAHLSKIYSKKTQLWKWLTSSSFAFMQCFFYYYYLTQKKFLNTWQNNLLFVNYHFLHMLYSSLFLHYQYIPDILYALQVLS